MEDPLTGKNKNASPTSPAPAGQIGRDDVAVLSFDDNRLAAALYGEHDSNLARIEQRLGVRMQTRGNRLQVTGTEDERAIAKAVLSYLYERLKGGQDITPGDVDGAVRLAETADVAEVAPNDVVIATRKRLIRPRSPGQLEYIRRLRDSLMVFGLGPAGTGKTYLAVAMAVARLLEGQVERVILSRPAVEAGERLGFLPGDLREKVDPYLRPLYDALHDTLPPEQVARRFERGEIEVAPLAFMRGRTLANSFVILDEAQNTTPMQMKMFLTRFGENSQMVIAGDPTQTDLPRGMPSGLTHAMQVLAGVRDVSFVHFTERDVVRHALVGAIVSAYDRDATRTSQLEKERRDTGREPDGR
ncbi:MAG: PhoH family protein [Sphingomonadales bacterium]